MANSFGTQLKRLRIERGLTLREFARTLDKDVGNLSKLERGLLPPPKDESIIRSYVKALGLDEESNRAKELIVLASVEAGQIPKEVLGDEELVAKLPVFFRTVTGSKLDRDKILSFLDGLRKT